MAVSKVEKNFNTLLDILIDDYSAKEKEGVSMPALKELRLLRGDEIEEEEDAKAETTNTAEDGGKEA